MASNPPSKLESDSDDVDCSFFNIVSSDMCVLVIS